MIMPSSLPTFRWTIPLRQRRSNDGSGGNGSRKMLRVSFLAFFFCWTMYRYRYATIVMAGAGVGRVVDGSSARFWNSTQEQSAVAQPQQQQQQSSPSKQGFGLPEGLLEWDLSLSPPVTAPGSRKFTRTICTTSRKGHIFPVPTIRAMFKEERNVWGGKSDGGAPKTAWVDVVEPSNDPDACSSSRVRVLFDYGGETWIRRERILKHIPGHQLTSCFVGGEIDKAVLSDLIKERSSLLKGSMPATRVFDSIGSCRSFCDGEWNQSSSAGNRGRQEWIWKPKNSSKGKGIVLIGGGLDVDLDSCRRHCDKTGGNTQAQALTATMTMNDGRKFDVRSHILVASLEPLVIFAGAERIRICAEPMDMNTNATSDSDNGLWKPFQQVCNQAVGKKHPAWTPSGNTGPLRKAITDPAAHERIVRNMDGINRELVELLKHRWSGAGAGMFQVFAVDYLVDVDEKVWLLEWNKQPGFTRTGIDWPNPWGDIFRIEWELIRDYHLERNISSSSSSNSNHEEKEKDPLLEQLSKLELETLRMLQM